MPLEVVRYRAEHAPEWNRFVAGSKNGTFLFDRGFMDYHSDRFKDHSLLFLSAGKILALFPANLTGNTISSHGGLTYGGIISDRSMQAGLMLEVVPMLLDYYRSMGVKTLIYKAVPHIYHREPAEEDCYALFRFGLCLSRVDISTTIDLSMPLHLAKGKKHGLSKARRANIVVTKSEEYGLFWKLLQNVLRERHEAVPTHSLEEMMLLATRFPHNIALYTASAAGELLAGAVVFCTERVAHTQYMAVSDAGREVGALDAVIHSLLTGVYRDKRYFDFGTSTEREGQLLNEGLSRQKEAFGGSGTVCCAYRLDLS